MNLFIHITKLGQIDQLQCITDENESVQNYTILCSFFPPWGWSVHPDDNKLYMLMLTLFNKFLLSIRGISEERMTKIILVVLSISHSSSNKLIFKRTDL